MLILLWYKLLRNFSIIGAACSIFITLLYFVLFWLLIKNPENQSKIVEETSLEKYMNVIIAGIIVTSIFCVILILTEF